MLHEPVFCRDGVLRLHRAARDHQTGADYPLLLPVVGVERVLNLPQLLSLLYRGFEFEEGLTMRELMDNLEPWASLVSQLSGIDFPAFLAEAHLPAPEGQRIDDVDRVEIRWRAELSAMSAYDEPPGAHGVDDFLRRIPGSRAYTLIKRPPLVTDQLEYEGGWDAVGVYRELQPAYEGAPPTIEDCSFLGTSLSCWAHLPVTVSLSGEIHDRTPGSPHLTDRGGVLRSGAAPDREARKRRMTVTGPTLFDGVVMALLHPIGFFGPPAAREHAVASIRDAAAEIDRQRKEDSAAREADPDAVAALEHCSLAEENDGSAVGFDERSLAALDLARRVDRLMPGLVRTPNGFPT